MKSTLISTIFALLLPIFSVVSANAQTASLPTTTVPPAANNANTTVRPYLGEFAYGSNLGYYGNGWNDEKLVGLTNQLGMRTIRPTLPESFLEQWGYNVRLSTFKLYSGTLGMREMTCFVEKPSLAHQDKTIYPGATKSSKLFANLYQPIWQADGTVNPNNYYAAYIYKLIVNYGEYIRFWEVVNEPDFGYKTPADWLVRAPQPAETPNTLAPFFHYVRMLRITSELVRKYCPEDYVTTGGIGYSEYLDALLRYTDNPDGGAVTAEYPNTGGAYFDVLSFHEYPAYKLHSWSNASGGFVYRRTSDYAAQQVISSKNQMEAVLKKYGYDGVRYPKKPVIMTECAINRRTLDSRTSSDEMQRNFAIKSLVLAQKNDIKQYYFYTVGEQASAPSAGVAITGSDAFSLMGLYENLKRDAPGQEKPTQMGLAVGSTSQQLLGYRYDAARTAGLNMPTTVDGGAFVKDGKYVYVLWAKTLIDQSEQASTNYSFPSTWNISQVVRSEWDYARSKTRIQQAGQGIALTGSPSFFTTTESTTLTSTNSAAVPLPVTLTAFTAQRIGSTTQLTWQTASELNNAHFEVEMSADGKGFHKVGANLTGRGTSTTSTNYTFTDPHLLTYASNLVYYRLRQVDTNGINTFSPVRTVHVEETGSTSSVSTYPNPFNEQAKVRFTSAQSGAVTLQIYDLQGRLVQNLFSGLAVEGVSQEVAIEGIHWPAGTYLLRLQTPTITTTQKLNVNH
jgi:hypothetical protein